MATFWCLLQSCVSWARTSGRPVSPSVSSSLWTLYLPSRPHGWQTMVICDLPSGAAKSLRVTAPLLGIGTSSGSDGRSDLKNFLGSMRCGDLICKGHLPIGLGRSRWQPRRAFRICNSQRSRSLCPQRRLRPLGFDPETDRNGHTIKLKTTAVMRLLPI